MAQDYKILAKVCEVLPNLATLKERECVREEFDPA